MIKGKGRVTIFLGVIHVVILLQEVKFIPWQSDHFLIFKQVTLCRLLRFIDLNWWKQLSLSEECVNLLDKLECDIILIKNQ